MILVSFDPSGAYREGNGTTGYTVLNGNKVIAVGQIRAIDYEVRQQYWQAHTELITSFQPQVVVAEEFRLYKDKASSQTHSEMETSKLLGYLEMFCYRNDYPFVTQSAREAKKRWTDEILVRKGVMKKTSSGRRFILNNQVSGHVVDSLRHAMHYKLKERKRKNGKSESTTKKTG